MPERSCKMPENTYREDVLKIWPGRGLDYSRVADVVGLTNDDLSRVAQVAKSRVCFGNHIPPALKERRVQILHCFLQVAEHFDGNGQKASLWFKTTNPMLGGISPRDMIRFGRLSKLQRLILGALLENRQSEPQAQAT